MRNTLGALRSHFSRSSARAEVRAHLDFMASHPGSLSANSDRARAVSILAGQQAGGYPAVGLQDEHELLARAGL